MWRHHSRRGYHIIKLDWTAMKKTELYQRLFAQSRNRPDTSCQATRGRWLYLSCKHRPSWRSRTFTKTFAYETACRDCNVQYVHWRGSWFEYQPSITKVFRDFFVNPSIQLCASKWAKSLNSKSSFIFYLSDSTFLISRVWMDITKAHVLGVHVFIC